MREINKNKIQKWQNKTKSTPERLARDFQCTETRPETATETSKAPDGKREAKRPSEASDYVLCIKKCLRARPTAWVTCYKNIMNPRVRLAGRDGHVGDTRCSKYFFIGTRWRGRGCMFCAWVSLFCPGDVDVDACCVWIPVDEVKEESVDTWFWNCFVS